MLREALGDGEDITAARIVIDKALSGDMVAARFVVGRLEPRPRSRPIELDLPEGTSAGNIVAAYDVTLRAMASGEITPEEALQVSRVLDRRLRALKLAAREDVRNGLSDRAKPSPSSGRGLGEGVGRSSAAADKASSRRPHPHPLPWGEGVAWAARRSNHLHFACILLATGAFGTRHTSRNPTREDRHELRSCGDGAPPRQRADERRRMAGPLRSRRLLSARLPQRLIRRLDREDPGYRT